MGMICNLYGLKESQIQELLSNDNPEEKLMEFEEEADEFASCDLDKSWHAIHFLLSNNPDVEFEGKSDNPLHFLLEGGRDLLPDDFTSPRLFFPHEVLLIHQALSTISREDFAKKFNPASFYKNEIYSFSSETNQQEDAEYILDHFLNLKNFIQKVNERKEGIIINIC